MSYGLLFSVLLFWLPLGLAIYFWPEIRRAGAALLALLSLALLVTLIAP